MRWDGHDHDMVISFRENHHDPPRLYPEIENSLKNLVPLHGPSLLGPYFWAQGCSWDYCGDPPLRPKGGAEERVVE